MDFYFARLKSASYKYTYVEIFSKRLVRSVAYRLADKKLKTTWNIMNANFGDI